MGNFPSDYDAWKTRSDRDEDPTNGGTEEPCEKCGRNPGEYLMQRDPGGNIVRTGILICEECAKAYEEALKEEPEPPFINPDNDF